MELVEYLTMNISRSDKKYIVANGVVNGQSGILLIAPYKDAKEHWSDYDSLSNGLSDDIKLLVNRYNSSLEDAFVVIMHTTGEYKAVKILKDDDDVSKWMRRDVKERGDINYLTTFNWSTDLQKYL